MLGQHKLLFLAWLPFSGFLLYAGKLSRKDAELIILRVGHLRDCEYELQQHRRLARSRGVDEKIVKAVMAQKSSLLKLYRGNRAVSGLNTHSAFEPGFVRHVPPRRFLTTVVPSGKSRMELRERLNPALEYARKVFHELTDARRKPIPD